jgi:hypothetical protein
MAWRQMPIGGIMMLFPAWHCRHAIDESQSVSHGQQVIYGYATSACCSQLIMPHIPSHWALSITHTASEFVASQYFANIHNLPPVPTPPLDLITYLACCQLSRILAEAYLNPSQYMMLPCRCLLITWDLVHLDIDLVRYNEALDKHQSGLNEQQEGVLFEKFPPSGDMVVHRPSVFVDAGGRVLLWYLPGAIHSIIRVGLSLQLLPSN